MLVGETSGGNSFGLKISGVDRMKIYKMAAVKVTVQVVWSNRRMGLDRSPIKGTDQGDLPRDANWTFAHVLFRTTWKLFVVQKCAKISKALVQIVSHRFSHNLIDRLTKRGWTVYSVSLLKAEKLKNRGDLSREGKLRNADRRQDNRDEPSEFKLKRFYD